MATEGVMNYMKYRTASLFRMDLLFLFLFYLFEIYRQVIAEPFFSR